MTRSITVYGRENCQPCRATRRRLDVLGVAYQFRNVETYNYGRLEDDLRASGYRSLPVVEVTHDDGNLETWSGFRPDKLDQLAAEPLFDMPEGTR